MRLIRYSSQGSERFGVASESGAVDLSKSYPGFAEMVADAPRRESSYGGPALKLDPASLLPPFDRRSKFLCMAVNYHSHIKEMKRDPTNEPILFPKFFTSLTGPYSDIPMTGLSEILDYEGELAVVIGKTTRGIAREEAWGHIAGITLVNDVSARSLFNVPQGSGVMLDWFSCKALDRSTPVGPWIVTKDEAGDFDDIRVETFLNGDRVQSARASDMVFDVPKIVEFTSSRLTLDPGDVISTGTSAGVGVARGRTLRKGDVVRVQADRIGHLENRVV